MNLIEVIAAYRYELIKRGRGQAEELLLEMVDPSLVEHITACFDFQGNCASFSDMIAPWPIEYSNSITSRSDNPHADIDFRMVWGGGNIIEIALSANAETRSEDNPNSPIFTGSLSSNLKSDEDGDEDYNVAIDGMEALILAMACNGVDLTDPRISVAIATATEAIANNA